MPTADDASSRPEGRDPLNPGGSPLPPDRRWVHPSELGPLPAPARRRRGVLTAAGLGALAGALLVGGVLGLVTMLERGTGESPAPGTSGDPELDAGILSVRVGSRWASGVCIRHSGDVLTAAAVVIGGGAVELVVADGRRIPATVVGIDGDTGLALLHSDARLVPARLAETGPGVGDAVMAVGLPATGTEVVRTGRVLAPRGRIALPTLATDVAAGTGMTGGALLDASGAAVGILVGPGTRGLRAVPIGTALGVAARLRSGRA